MEHTDIICGRNAVNEALRGDFSIDCLYVAAGERHGSLGGIIAKYRAAGIPVKQVDKAKLDAMCGETAHQGVAAAIAAVPYCDVEDILREAEDRGEPPFLVMCDGIEDPHNLGAIIRTCEAAGVHGVILPKRRAAGATATVAKTSAGALALMKVAKVSNLADTIARLKKRGVWIYGADVGGKPYRDMDYSGGACLVIGSEGRGLARLTAELCDQLIALPMRGRVNSLNASVACGVLLYEIAHQRSG